MRCLLKVIELHVRSEMKTLKF